MLITSLSLSAQYVKSGSLNTGWKRRLFNLKGPHKAKTIVLTLLPVEAIIKFERGSCT
jgi:hypothetical protein